MSARGDGEVGDLVDLGEAALADQAASPVSVGGLDVCQDVWQLFGWPGLLVIR